MDGGMQPDAEADLSQLEEIILSKIQQRTPARMNEDTYIVKVFRFHDLSGTGYVEFDKFKKALLPFTSGISEQDLYAIFQRYAGDMGALNYKAFAVEFVGGMRRYQAGIEMDEGPDMLISPEEIVFRIKAYLQSQGPRGVTSLASAFRDADPGNSRQMSYDVFHQVLSSVFAETPCAMSKDQVDAIFTTFRQMYSPTAVAYDEFFLALKDELSPERRASIRAAFRRLDMSSEGLVDMNAMIDAYNASRHPMVADGSRRPEEVRDEFAETIKDLVAFRRGLRSYPTNLIAWEEFEDYYKFINGCFETDALFCSTMQRVWDLDKLRNVAIEARAAMAAPAAGIPAKSRAGLHHWQTNTLPKNPTYRSVQTSVDLNNVLGRTRKIIANRGLRAAVDVVKNYYAADDDVDDMLDVYEFRRASANCQLKFKDEEEQRVFEVIGEPPSGQKLSVPKFLARLQGEMSASRQQVVETVFRSFRDNGDLEMAIPPSVLKDRFACEAHPQVQRNELDPAVVLTEFLDTFSLLAHVRGGCQNGMVTFQDFAAYYEVVSSIIDNDAYFELLMRRLWSLPIEPEYDEDPNQRPPSPYASRSMAVYDSPVSPMAETRPPPFSGPSVYATNGYEGITAPETHHRFARQTNEENAAIPAFSPITKSSIVFGETESAELNAVIERLRSAIVRRGFKGWQLLAEHFARYDNRRNGTIMRMDWERMTRTLGLGLSPEEREGLFKSLSINRKDGAMDSALCLKLLKGEMAPKQQQLVGALFNRIKDGAVVPVKTVQDLFDPRNTPMCLLRRKDPQQAAEEFRNAAAFFAPNGSYDPEAFVEFFCMVLVLCEDDDEFRLMTTAAFGVPMEAWAQ